MTKRAIIVSILIIFFAAGCATIPTQEGLPTYNLNGITYLPLVTLCEKQGLNWDYDTFTRQVTLTKDTHKINLMVGDNLVLVDGNLVHLKHRVDFYQGTVVVPYKFKEQVLDVLAVAPIAKIKKIVIDAGHGGNDPGAIGRTGIREKDVNLDIAKRLSKLLRDQGFQVVMTRSTDKFVPLSSRADIANKSKAELFLSIHANANRVRSLSGFEVYYVSSSADDSQRALSAAQNAELDLESSCFASNSLNLKAILWDMIYTNSRAESIRLARSICRTIDRSLETKILGIKAARFYVLKGVRMPAVLIETGFLSNIDEERRLKNSYYRQQVAEAIAAGVKSYTQDILLSEAVR